jgi:hypothetical protein
MKAPLIALTALLAATAGTALAQNHWHGHDWDPPASQQWHRTVRHEEHHEERRNRRMVYAPRHGAAVREYVYYPNARAYYAPWNHRWYYRHGSRWVVAERAPVSINLGNGINISLGADSPVVYDSYVVGHYRDYY